MAFVQLVFVFIAFMISFSALAKIKEPEQNFSIGFASEAPNFEFLMTPTNKDIDTEIKYQPNLHQTTGLTATVYGVGVRYLTQEDFTEKEQRRKGNTSYDDIRLGTSFGNKLRHRIEGHYTRYKGLFIENSSDIDSSFSGSSDKIQRDDIEIVTWGLEFYWILDPEEWSQAAAFTQSAIQVESGGSWILKFDYDAASFHADSAIVPTQVTADFGEDAGLREGKFNTLSALGGYGYTAVWNHLYITPMGLIGYGLQDRRFNLGGGRREGSSTVQKFNFALATGYNGDRFFTSVKGDFNSLVYKTGSIRIQQSLIAFTLSLGCRF